MEKHIKKLNEGRYDESFGRTSDWLITSRQKLLNRKTKRSNTKMKEFLLRHKLQFAIIVLAAILIAACNMPVTQNDTVGYALSWTVPGSAGQSASDNLNKLEWFKNSSVSSAQKNINGQEIIEYKLIVQSADDKAVIKYKEDLEKIKEISSIKIVPLNESVTRPVYSAALHSFFKVDINSEKMTDEQVSSEISRQLEQAGFDNVTVSYKPDINGKKKLEIKMKDGFKMEGNKRLEVNVDNKNGKDVIKMKTMQSDVDFSKMTDAEIREYVKKQNPEDELKDGDIKIERKENGVNVNVEKEETK